MEVGKKLQVLDKKTYLCKITEVDEINKKIKIHFQNWSERHDEEIYMDSDRIVSDSHDDPNASNSSASAPEVCEPIETQCRVAIGKLLMSCSEVPKKVISAFDYRSQQSQNEKSLDKFYVPMLEETAEHLKISLYDMNNKKLYNKSMLIRKIINTIRSILPTICSTCNNSYSLEIGKKSDFICAKCERGSHNCSTLSDFHLSLPQRIPTGFLWFCSDCCSDFLTSKVQPSQVELTGAASTNEIISSQQSNSFDAISMTTVPVSGDRNDAESDQISDSILEQRSPVNNADAPRNVTKVCTLYKKGICPHGLKGNKVIDGKKCILSHPKTCMIYAAYGSKDPRGCKLGSSCTYFHPVLCRYSVKSRRCTNEKCTFVHLKGTKREKSDFTVSEAVQSSKKTMIKENHQISKNDPMERLEEMIMEMRKSQESEMSLIRQEMNYLRTMNSQPQWGSPQNWYPPLHAQGYPSTMSQYPNQQNPQMTFQSRIQQGGERMLGVGQSVPQMRQVKPETIGGLPLSY